MRVICRYVIRAQKLQAARASEHFQVRIDRLTDFQTTILREKGLKIQVWEHSGTQGGLVPYSG